MLCPRCRAELFPGMRQCPECGALVYVNTYRTASVTVTGREARQGAFKTLNMPQMTGPVRYRLKPGTKNGAQIMVNNAVFQEPDGSTVLVPVRVTVHVKKSPAVLVVPVLVALLCMSFVFGIGQIVSALMTDGAPVGQTQMQTVPTQTTLPPLTSETQPQQPSTEPPVIQPETEPETQPATEPPATEPQTTSESPIMYFEMRPLLHQLDDRLLTNLKAIYEAAMNFETEVVFPCNMTPEELAHLRTLMHTEFPELMQLDNTISTTYYTDRTTGYVTSMELPYSLTKAEYDRRYEACMAVIGDLVSTTQGMDDWEKERFVFDYIASNCIYSIEGDQTYAPYGTLVNQVAKCDGISLAFKWIMEEMGITTLCITGDPTVGDIGHAWNMILLDGAYYNVDVTIDVHKKEDPGPTLYKALNVTNEMVLRDYVLNPVFTQLLTIPQVTTMEKSYHVQNGSYVTSGSDWQTLLGKCFLKTVETGEYYPVQFESRADFDSCLQGIGDAVNGAASEAGIYNISWQYYYSEEFRTVCIMLA